MAVTLKTWQVKTICPASSDEEGDGIDVCPESDGTADMMVGKPKSGVEIGSPGAGEESEEGVDA
jgi:hypothetical protein